MRLGFSGDVLNAAAAAAAAGARTAVLTAVADDELGDAILARMHALGIDTSLVRRSPRANGAYLLTGDLHGARDFIYWRTGSAASTLDSEDVRTHAGAIRSAGALVLSGIAAALSDTAERAVLMAADLATTVVYDPNFRRKLTSPQRAWRVLTAVAPHCALVTPSCPGDTEPLLGTTDPRVAAERVVALGARCAAVTAGLADAVLATGTEVSSIPVSVNPDAVDATGAGDVLTGTAAARLALGDPMLTAVTLGIGAASCSVAGRGGTGHIPTLTETRAILAGRI